MIVFRNDLISGKCLAAATLLSFIFIIFLNTFNTFQHNREYFHVFLFHQILEELYYPGLSLFIYHVHTCAVAMALWDVSKSNFIRYRYQVTDDSQVVFFFF